MDRPQSQNCNQEKARLYTRMKKTKKEKDIRKYRQCNGDVKKIEKKQAYFSYINNIIEVNDDRTINLQNRSGSGPTSNPLEKITQESHH